MSKFYRVELTLRSGDWRRGKATDIAAEFDDARPEEGYDDSVVVTYEVSPSVSGYGSIPGEWEAYRLARNRAESRIEMEGWDARVSGMDIEQVEREREPIENPTIDDAKNWVEYEEGDECDWVHEPTNNWLAIREDGPNVREDWHNDTWCEELPWVVVHPFTVIGRHETEAEAREAALKWMVTNPYSLDPANSYM